MALSIYTNAASMTSSTAMNKATGSLNIAMQRLGTGKRINSAADDAAGLQIASRLQAQSNGMGVAKDNIAKATAMMQTAEGAFDEVNNILYRMKDLATQAADDTNNEDDRAAISSEYGELNAELENIMSNTSYGTEKLLGSVSGSVQGKLTKELQFQIGASTDETLKVNLSGGMAAVTGALATLLKSDLSSAKGGNAAIDEISNAMKEVGTMRSTLGANINRMGHTAANLANMQDNTNLNIGIIRDADFAVEATLMTRNQMLTQSSQAMLKQANGMGQMVLGMLG